MDGVAIPAAVARPARAVLRRVWMPVGLLIVWQGWVTFGDVAGLVIPPPGEVLAHIAGQPGHYVAQARSTLSVAALGLVLGMAIGLTLAIAGWLTPFFSGLVSPAALMLRSIPITAMIPVIARIFGYNGRTVVAVAVLISIFPTFVFASSGLRAAPPGARDYFSVMRAGRRTRLRRLALPAAMPNILTAFRISAGLCLLGALVAEWLIGAEGLGHRLALARIEFQIDELWGIALVATGLSVAAFIGASALERWANDRWS